ncbi:kinesin family member pavarotti [Arctopsyche grandis]|uniref:kinesin family member pavarotti n=1 Tax=Arctopsyche grandis TaxID=121162 RepID=UPI00406D98EB
MKPFRPKTPGKLTKQNSKENIVKDPVQVYCRVRWTQEIDVNSCMRVVSPTCICLTPPENYRGTNYKPINYSFREVFTQDGTQHDVFNKVGLPLVENLIKGKSGLLFTYGVTGSGKTFTMTGEPSNAGIMPRCLDVIFRTIDTVQARRFVFTPDKMNMFEIQGDAEAALQRQQHLHKMTTRSTRKNNSNPDLALSDSNSSKLQGIDEDCLYAVFVTYIEIYNNNVYDLLEEGTLGRKSPQTKIVREDAMHNMYVHGVTEVEVKTREEALEAFYKGLKRKRMAHTSLNAESSRSHSVFTIRLVQAPVDSMGENIVQDKKNIVIRQLSLVDLAGSERTSRTNNTGQRLREAGNINNSLMTLRACLEALRENQQVGGISRIVPYRDAKITHLFKNFFDGDGQVRMIVCANPSCEDYDETLQVMRFAEVAMEVEVSRPRALIDIGAGMTPGRRKANLLFKQAREKILSDGRSEANNLEVDLALVYSLGGDFPSLELGTTQAEETIKKLVTHLELRLQRRKALLRDKAVRDDKFRSRLDELMKGNLMAGSEVATIRAQLMQERQRSQALEGRLMTAENIAADLRRRLTDLEKNCDNLQQELSDKDMKLNQKTMEKENQKRRYSQKIASERDKLETALKVKMWEEKHKNQKVIEDKEKRMRLAQEILSNGQGVPMQDEVDSKPLMSERSNDILSTPVATPNTLHPSRRGVAVSNPRHRRSLSADGTNTKERWIEHLPNQYVPTGTAFKLLLPRKKSLNRVINIKDITNSKVSNYCLISQEQDTDGELEMKVFKGNVVPTCSGGAQVQFNDVEMLKQMGPLATPGKKREGCETPMKRLQGENQWKKPRV